MSIHGNFDFSKVTIYLVGGFVRDYFMGIEPKDKDYVVVGSNPEEMLSLGFRKVGADFPVYLHPETNDEYALARTERKSGAGYNGFECEWEGVTLEEDLSRRDLTINSIAWDCTRDIGKIYDPFGGRQDIKSKVLRPTTEAFQEDAIRLLRVGRFFARYPEFRTALNLAKQCRRLESKGELLSLIPERVWLETSKALGETRPSRYFKFISSFDFPFVEFLHDMKNTVENNVYHRESSVFEHTMMVLDYASEHFNDPEINFAALLHDIAKHDCYKERGNGHGHDKDGVVMIEEFCTRWKVPNNFRDLAKITCEQHQKIHSVFGRDANKMTKPKSIMKIFEQTSALSKPERFKKILKVCEADSHGRIGISANDEYKQRQYLEECLSAVINLDTKSITQKALQDGKQGTTIGLMVREARIKAIREVMNSWK